MLRSCHRITRVPVGTKYILEASGAFVRRFIEFPDGRKLKLKKRKSAGCNASHPTRAASRRRKGSARIDREPLEGVDAAAR